MPARYRPDTAGYSKVSRRSAKITVTALSFLDIADGDVVSFMPRTESSLTMRAGQHTGTVATHPAYYPHSNTRTGVMCTIAGKVLDYLDLDNGDRIVYRYPEDRDAEHMVVEGVTDGR